MVFEHTIVIAIQGNRYCTIIPRGTILPASVKDQNYAIPNPDGDVEIRIYRGESGTANNDNLIGVLHLDPLQMEQERYCRFAVTYSLDPNGMLSAMIDTGRNPYTVQFDIGMNSSHSRSLATDVFISHAEEDWPIAAKIAQALDSRGYSTWCYERDGGIPGVSYLEQIIKAIDQSRVILVLVSHNSLDSHQVDNELVSAFEAKKPFMPILYGIKHAEMKTRKCIWNHIFGPTSSISIPSKGVTAIIPRIATGLQALDIVPGDR